MSRGLVLGVLLGAGGATAFWRMKVRELKQLAAAAPPAPLRAQTETVEPAVEKVIQSAGQPETAAFAGAEPVEQSRAQPPETVSPAAPAAGFASLVTDAKLSEQTGSSRPETTAAKTSPLTPSAIPTRPAQDAKTAALVNKFMTKGVIPRLHEKIQDLFRVDEGLKKVRTAE
eukprot:COSAG02_NODE_24076_length_698_cov_1.495826_1_plen_171_part_01